MYTYLCTKIILLYELGHVISKDFDAGTAEADSRACAPLGLSVATPLLRSKFICNWYAILQAYLLMVVSITVGI